MNVPFIDLKAQFATIRTEVQEAIHGILETQQFILGPEVAALEQEISLFTHTQHAIGCASGTDALLLCLTALGVGPGDEVITSAYSFFATAGSIAWLGAKPVFLDIDPDTYLMRVEQTESRITTKTKAIVGVHLFGQCCRIEELSRFDIPVIEDAAQAIGAFRDGLPAGSLGKASCFSFFPTKNLGAYGDGGMITTNDDRIAERIRELHAHGEKSPRYHHQTLGINSRLDALQAAVLRVKLRRLNSWNLQRARHARHYIEKLNGLPLILPKIENGNSSNFHQFLIQTDHRDSLQEFLKERQIQTAVYYPVPLPHQPCFTAYGYQQGQFPDAERCSQNSLALPVYPELSAEQLDHVTNSIHDFFALCS